MHTILDKIAETKRREVATAKLIKPLCEIAAKVHTHPYPRDFTGAIVRKISSGRPAVVAEIKRTSPSTSYDRIDFSPADIARDYAKHGAACISVLTDGSHFGGAFEHLHQARSACDLPVLRKDFIIDRYQIFEARAMEADCILLIVALLTEVELREFEAVAHDLGMAVLIEVRSQAELDVALRLKTPLVGINNRDLRDFSVSLLTTTTLISSIPSDRIVIAESGIAAKEDVDFLRGHGVNAFLVGEALMRASNPGRALLQLFFPDAIVELPMVALKE